MLRVSSIWNAENGGGTEQTSRPRYGMASGSRHSGLNAARSSSASQPPASCTARVMVRAIGPR